MQRILSDKGNALHFPFGMEEIEVAITFGISEIDLVDTVLIALLEDGGVVSLSHNHGHFILVGDGHGGLGNVAAKGAEQEMDLVNGHQALVEFRRFRRLALVIIR